MSTLSLRLPNSLHDRVRKLAEAEGVSINQFISTAVAETMSALMATSVLVRCLFGLTVENVTIFNRTGLFHAIRCVRLDLNQPTRYRIPTH